jgi:DNA-binding transcriptional MerR regulator
VPRILTRDIITAGKLADRLGVTRSTIHRWHELGLVEASRIDHRGLTLYHRDTQPPTPAQLLATQRPPHTADLITGGKLANKLGLARSTIYKWYQLGLIPAFGTDKTGRHLYRPDQHPPSPAQITAARRQTKAATARSRTSASQPHATIPKRHAISKNVESSTGGAV